MRRNTTVVVLGLLLVTGAALAAPPLDLPECVRHTTFAGITSTDAVGNVLGTPDPADWGCVGGGTLAAVPAPPPTNVCFGPAYPNPASGFTRVNFSLPQPANVSLVVYGQHGKHGRAFPVRTLASGSFAAGAFTVVWDLKDDAGAPLPPDIYRAVLVTGGHELCGDIEVR